MDDDDDQVDTEQIEMNIATEESLKLFQKEEEKRRLEKSKEEGKRKQVGEEEEDDKGQFKHSKDKQVAPPSCSICNGCKSEIKDGLSVKAFGDLWHPRCLCCLHCHKPIALGEVSIITIIPVRYIY